MEPEFDLFLKWVQQSKATSNGLSPVQKNTRALCFSLLGLGLEGSVEGDHDLEALELLSGGGRRRRT